MLSKWNRTGVVYSLDWKNVEQKTTSLMPKVGDATFPALKKVVMRLSKIQLKKKKEKGKKSAENIVVFICCFLFLITPRPLAHGVVAIYNCMHNLPFNFLLTPISPKMKIFRIVFSSFYPQDLIWYFIKSVLLNSPNQGKIQAKIEKMGKIL